MFSPSVADGGPATATRSRRRQRPLSSENLPQQPKAKRQRLPLTEQTFVNPEVQQEMIEVKTDKAATVEPKNNTPVVESPTLAPRKELNVRAKKPKHGDRAANKGDGSLVLVLYFSVAFVLTLHANQVKHRLAQTPTPLASSQLCPTEFDPTGLVRDSQSLDVDIAYFFCVQCRESNRRRLLEFWLCPDPYLYTRRRLAIQLDLAIPRNIHIHPSFSIKTERSPTSRMSRLSFCFLHRAWPGCGHGW